MLILKRFLIADRRGNVAVLFALSLIPLVGLLGLAVDVGRTFEAKTSLDASNDAAALSAATQAQAVLKSGGTSAQAQTAGQTAGAQMFSANAGRIGSIIGSTPTPVISVSIVNQTIAAQSTYTLNMPTIFGKIFGTPTMAISNTAKSTLTTPKYINISVAIDVSQSMGLAATTAGIAQLQSLTPDHCAFGCHVPQSGQTVPYETVAHTATPPIQLRIDVIKSATQNMISTAQSSQGTSGLISFALYELQSGPPTPGTLFTTIASPSNSYSSLYTAVSNIDLGPNDSNVGYGDSDFANSLKSLTNTIQTSGSGATSSTAQQFVFLMTDGVDDYYNSSCTWGHCTSAFNPTWCDGLKAKGVTVGVIYTTYLPLNGDVRYDTLVSSFANQIAPNLQSCASNGWFYQATDATDIQTAINALFAQATGRGVLTQ